MSVGERLVGYNEGVQDACKSLLHISDNLPGGRVSEEVRNTLRELAYALDRELVIRKSNVESFMGNHGIPEAWGKAFREAVERDAAARKRILPPSKWRQHLGFEEGQNPTVEEVKARFRERVQEVHPDTGGSQEDFVRVTRARDDAMEELGGPQKSREYPSENKAPERCPMCGGLGQRR
ncbi:MAG: hypothetical protein Q8P59_07360 [Dehalococcoidia bacterium]|nr:hypothetical protein [Dehalococcoidia bacterium]